MNILLSKLLSILATSHITPIHYFVYNTQLIYIEVKVHHEHFLIFIPNTYTIDINIDINTKIHNIHRIDIEETGDILDDYVGYIDDDTIEKDYNDIHLDIHMSQKIENINVINTIEKSYDCNISLQNIDKYDKNEILTILRQLRRLYLCIKNTQYNLTIIHDKYICNIESNDKYKVYSICNKENRFSSTKRFLMCIDLDVCIDNLEYIHVDISKVRHGIYNILDKNQQKHTHNIHKMLQSTNYIHNCSFTILRKKQLWTGQLYKLKQLLDTLYVIKQSLYTNKTEIQNTTIDTSIKGLYSDIANVRNLSNIDRDLDDIYKIEQEINRTISIIQSKKESLTLNADHICFENNIMMSVIDKNFKYLLDV